MAELELLMLVLFLVLLVFLTVPVPLTLSASLVLDVLSALDALLALDVLLEFLELFELFFERIELVDCSSFSILTLTFCFRESSLVESADCRFDVALDVVSWVSGKSKSTVRSVENALVAFDERLDANSDAAVDF